MAPIKFEEQLRDELEKRTLSPSSEGWSQLSDRLDVDEKKSKNPLFWWLSIAAGLIIMIAVSVQFFNNDDAQEVMPQVVEEQLKGSQLENNNENFNTEDAIELVVEEETLKDEKDSTPITDNAQIIDYKKVTYKKSEPKLQLTENSGSTTKTNTANRENVLKEAVSIITDESMMKEVVALTLNELGSEETSVTDREIDSLLKVASKELFKDKLQKDSSKTVDVDALLLSVEEDMGQSFRSKVFNALKESYKTVKTKVVERNN
jgi:hypothetical protein